MFRGSFSLTLDEKGRLALPTRYCDSLFADANGAMVCTIHIKDPCLLLYPLPEWEDVAEQLQRLSNQNAQELRFKRLLIGHASDCDMDKSGRILLPATLRSHANLSKNIRLVGQLNKFEIWDEDIWNKRVADDMALERDLPSDAELSERLQDFVL